METTSWLRLTFPCLRASWRRFGDGASVFSPAIYRTPRSCWLEPASCALMTPFISVIVAGSEAPRTRMPTTILDGRPDHQDLHLRHGAGHEAHAKVGEEECGHHGHGDADGGDHEARHEAGEACDLECEGVERARGDAAQRFGEGLDDEVVTVDAEEDQRHEECVELVEGTEFGAGDGVDHSAEAEAHLHAHEAGCELEADEDEIHGHAEGEPEECLAEDRIDDGAELLGGRWHGVLLQGNEHEREEDGEAHLGVRGDAFVAEERRGHQHPARPDKDEEEGVGERGREVQHEGCYRP